MAHPLVKTSALHIFSQPCTCSGTYRGGHRQMSGQIWHTEVRIVDAVGCLTHILAISLHLFPFYPLLPPDFFQASPHLWLTPARSRLWFFTAAITDFKYGQWQLGTGETYSELVSKARPWKHFANREEWGKKIPNATVDFNLESTKSWAAFTRAKQKSVSFCMWLFWRKWGVLFHFFKLACSFAIFLNKCVVAEELRLE